MALENDPAGHGAQTDDDMAPAVGSEQSRPDQGSYVTFDRQCCLCHVVISWCTFGLEPWGGSKQGLCIHLVHLSLNDSKVGCNIKSKALSLHGVPELGGSAPKEARPFTVSNKYGLIFKPVP